MKIVAMIFGAGLVIAMLVGYGFVANYGVNGSGVSLSEVRDLASFDKVSLAGTGTLNISFGKTSRVVVTTDDNLVELVETVVEDGRLKIDLVEAINPQTDLVVDVTLPTLTSVDISGAAIVNISGIDAESLDISVSGACRINGTGTVKDLSVDMSGACRARLKALKSENCTVDISGTGSARVFATVSIDASVSGLGSIKCYGNPKDVRKDSSGISKITIAGN